MELFFYILWIVLVYLYVQYVCHDVMAEASLILHHHRDSHQTNVFMLNETSK